MKLLAVSAAALPCIDSSSNPSKIINKRFFPLCKSNGLPDRYRSSLINCSTEAVRSFDGSKW